MEYVLQVLLLRYMVSLGRVPHPWDNMFLKLCCILSMFEDPALLAEDELLWRLPIFKLKIIFKVTFVTQRKGGKMCLKLLVSTLKQETIFHLESSQMEMDFKGSLADIVQTLQHNSEK